MKKNKGLILPEMLQEKNTFVGIEEYDVITNSSFHHVLQDTFLHNVEFKNCLFQDIEFQKEYVSKLDLTSARFEHCDLSNLDLRESTFYQVEFIDCKLMGTQFLDSHLKEVTFDNCHVKYSNFNGSNITSLIVKDCNCEETYWNYCKLNKLELCNSDFSLSEFVHTPLKNIDFRTNQIDGIKTDLESLKGIIVDTYQASTLVHFLEIVIK